MKHRIEEASDRLRKLWTSHGLVYLPFRMLVLSKILDRLASANILKGEQVTLAEWRVMANLARSGESTVNACAADSYVDRAEVSRAADGLEKKKLMERTSHPTSKAKRLLRLSPAGAEKAERIGAQRRRFYTYLMEGLSEDERRQFDDFLLHLAIRIEKFDAGQPGAPSDND